MDNDRRPRRRPTPPIQDEPVLCDFRWRDKDGWHACMALDNHTPHRCCCGSTMECGH